MKGSLDVIGMCMRVNIAVAFGRTPPHGTQQAVSAARGAKTHHEGLRQAYIIDASWLKRSRIGIPVVVLTKSRRQKQAMPLKGGIILTLMDSNSIG